MFCVYNRWALALGDMLLVDSGQFMWGQMWMVNEPEYYSERK